MRLAKTLTRIAPLCLVTACGASADLGASLDGALLAPCPAPQAIPDRELVQREVEALWGRDRDALRVCGARHAALAEVSR